MLDCHCATGHYMNLFYSLMTGLPPEECVKLERSLQRFYAQQPLTRGFGGVTSPQKNLME